MVRKSYYDFQERTGELESSSNYSAKNNLGCKGKYQFGVAALMDAGYYKGDKDGGWNNHWDGEWTGKDGIPWKNWSEKEQKGFLEGLIGKSLDEVDNDEKRNWTSKFNIGNPETDKGHWVTLDNGKHLFIKDG